MGRKREGKAKEEISFRFVEPLPYSTSPSVLNIPRVKSFRSITYLHGNLENSQWRYEMTAVVIGDGC